MFYVNKDNSELLQREYDVLLHLSAHRNSVTGKCFPSVETLANECHLSVRTVNDAIKGLAAKGWMTYKRGGLRGKLVMPNDYTLNTEKILAVKPVVAESTPTNEIVAKEQHVVDTISFDEVPEFDYTDDYCLVDLEDMSPQENTPVQIISEVKLNPDGSFMWFPNSTRRYTKDDVMQAPKQSEDQPF